MKRKIPTRWGICLIAWVRWHFASSGKISVTMWHDSRRLWRGTFKNVAFVVLL